MRSGRTPISAAPSRAAGIGRLAPPGSCSTPPATVTGRKFIAGAAEEAGDEAGRRAVVELERRADLLDPAGVEDDDPVGHRHRLDLVVGDVDRGGLQALVQGLDLGAHVDPQLGVEVGERLVEQEDLRVAHDGAAHRHALALPAGELARPAFEQVLDLQDGGGVVRRAGRSRRGCAGASSGRSPCCCAPSSADRARSPGTPSRCRARSGAGR